jgi:hypothetical protein
MYWYKLKLHCLVICLGGISLLFFYTACKPDISSAGNAPKYFDINGYFAGEAARLTKLNKPVLKTVIDNKNVETKQVFIKDWNTELDFFKSADINKPAWKNSYGLDSSGGFLIYKAKDQGLKTQELIIKKQDGKIKWILIFNHTKNLLYQTREKLTYYPDSLYLIQKKQYVRVLGINNYTIKGIFNR